LVIIHHELEGIQEIQALTRLTALFLLDNRIRSLTGIEELKQWNNSMYK
jgi:hypothetical protein